MQHGEAKTEDEDPTRPLTDDGRAEVERVARLASRLRLGIVAVAHSGKTRARETAEIVVAALQPAPALRELAGLGPNDDPAAVARAVEPAGETWLLVGHLPHLCRLASLLLVGDPDRTVIAFRMGGLVALAREGTRWHLRWILTPEIAAAG